MVRYSTNFLSIVYASERGPSEGWKLSPNCKKTQLPYLCIIAPGG